jgi:hypothetical protein
MIIREVKTLSFDADYDIGSIGFLDHPGFIQRGIEWFTRHWRDKTTPAVDHVYVVIGDGRIVEANGDGVDVEPLNEYLLDPACRLYFRRVRGWTPDLGGRIAAEALKYEGLRYDYGLIVADAIGYSIAGRLIDRITDGAVYATLANLAAGKRRMICDELACVAMQAQPDLHPLGTLKFPAAQNNPQRLFGDEELFEPEVVMVRGRKMR